MNSTIVGLLSKAVALERISKDTKAQHGKETKKHKSCVHSLILVGFCGALRTTPSSASGGSGH
jgi:fluoride ion exporter CrcB/FEX